MRVLALLALLLTTPASPGAGIQVMLDGQFVGTLAGQGLQLDLSLGTIKIETREGVFGCRLDLIFWDRYE